MHDVSNRSNSRASPGPDTPASSMRGITVLQRSIRTSAEEPAREDEGRQDRRLRELQRACATAVARLAARQGDLAPLGGAHWATEDREEGVAQLMDLVQRRPLPESSGLWSHYRLAKYLELALYHLLLRQRIRDRILQRSIRERASDHRTPADPAANLDQVELIRIVSTWWHALPASQRTVASAYMHHGRGKASRWSGLDCSTATRKRRWRQFRSALQDLAARSHWGHAERLGAIQFLARDSSDDCRGARRDSP